MFISPKTSFNNFLGIKYYLQSDYRTAYNYFKLGFEVGYPIGSQYSLKPTLTYHFLPKFLTEVCYYLEDYELGKQAAHLFLTTYNTPSSDCWNLMINWYRIHSNLVLMGPISQNPIIPNVSKIFCIVTDGGWEPWTGKDILTKGLGGSETWIIQTARYLKQTTNFDVMVFCKTSKSKLIKIFCAFCCFFLF